MTASDSGILSSRSALRRRFIQDTEMFLNEQLGWRSPVRSLPKAKAVARQQLPGSFRLPMWLMNLLRGFAGVFGV